MRSIVVYPFGFPVQVNSDSTVLLGIVEEAWGHLTKRFDERPVIFDLEVHQTAGDGTVPEYRASEQGFCLRGDQDYIHADLSARRARGSVSIGLAKLPDKFRYFYLDAAVLTMLSHCYLAPTHGALVSWEGKGYLLCGSSKSGKSTLAYACARSGWTYTSDDGTFLVRDAPGLTAVGNCHSVRLRPPARMLFPELADQRPTVRPNGQWALQLDTRNAPTWRTSPVGHIDQVVFLRREDRATAEAEPIAADRLLAYLEDVARPIAPASVFRDQQSVYERFRAIPCFEMRYDGLDNAMRCLKELS